MLKSFLRVAIRNFTRRKAYSLLNLLGLTIGITCCLLIFEYVGYERSYDRFQKNADRIFRVQESDYQNGRFEVQWASTSPGVGPALKKDFPEVVDFCRLTHFELLLSNDARNAKFWETRSYVADASALNILDLQLIKGNPATALQGDNKIVISEDMARKYFGTTDALGKILTDRNGGKQRYMEVTGVFKNYPANSHLALDVLISYRTLRDFMTITDPANDPSQTSWSWSDYYTYIELKKGTDLKAFQAKLPDFANRHYNGLPENKAHNDYYTFELFPLSDIHLYSHYGEEAEANGDGSSVTFLFMIAFFIAAIAWINFINLATARSLERAREVGVRKVLGAIRADLIGQFMVESLVLNGLALLLAVLIAWLAGPIFNELTGRTIQSLFLPATYWEIFLAFFLGGAFLSGLYPAFVLSRYHPVAVLKGLFKNSSGGQFLRKGLIVGQFAASILLIAGTIIVYNQVHYMRSRSLGINIDQTLVVNGVESMQDSVFKTIYPAFEQEVLRVKDVKGITGSSNVMGQEITWSTVWRRLRGASRTNYTLLHLGVDYNFIGNYGLKVVAGRGFSRDFSTDKKAVLLNESGVRELGYAKPEDAIGEWLHGDQTGIDTVQVIGVVADYHQQGLQKAIQPMVLLLRPTDPGYFSIKVGAGNSSSVRPTAWGGVSTIAAIKQIWDRHFPADPFHYFFLDDFFNRQYAENQRFGAVFGLFAVLAIVIACLGLLGLSAYNVLQRTKEIGIRQVLGASTRHLLYILSRDFLLLVSLAFVIAIPITWFVMDRWLREFAYRIHIGWGTFAVAGALAFVIALFTVGAQALKAALANPIESLRSE